MTDKQFDDLAKTWNRETMYRSDAGYDHPISQTFIAEGEPAARWMLTKLAQYAHEGKFKPGSHKNFNFSWGWFGVLRVVLGVDPIEKGHEGRLHLIIEDWLTWAVTHGYLV